MPITFDNSSFVAGDGSRVKIGLTETREAARKERLAIAKLALSHPADGKTFSERAAEIEEFIFRPASC